MPVPLYMDVHVPSAITGQLRRRGVDALTAQEDGMDGATDDEILLRAEGLGRVVFTQDIRFVTLAEQWQASGTRFAGLVFGHQLGGTIGQYVRDLELIAKASEPDEWIGHIQRLPF